MNSINAPAKAPARVPGFRVFDKGKLTDKSEI